jgi:hypothetical protein
MGTDKTDPLKQETPVSRSPLIRAGREIRGQNSFSLGVRILIISVSCDFYDEGLKIVSSSMSAALPLWSNFFKSF